ncbi:GpE family phage tail protein [Azonexus sp. R2A61]|nr:GpE family phage tail protein [Azonexus sp. R2A61]
MADIAVVFHWTPESMNPMELDELCAWRARAAARMPKGDGNE